MNVKNLMKYFVHGIAYSILFLILEIVWVFIFAILVAIGWIIGLIIGFGLLLLIIGFVNSVITSWLWFPVKMSFWSTLSHGFVLFIALLFVNGVVVIVPYLFFPELVTTVVTFIVGSFLSGFVGKKVAGWWRETAPERVPKAIEAEWRDRKL